MIIAYRRMSGKVALTDNEKGDRGLWLEKRRALFKHLRGRGHELRVVGRLTENTAEVEKSWDSTEGCDLLMIEFGSSNYAFYGEDLDLTEKIYDGFKGTVIFINDDPDLPFVWKRVKNSTQREVFAWYNAYSAAPFGGQPNWVKTFDMPFSALQYPGDFQHYESRDGDKFCYVGRPNGREKIFQDLIVRKVPFAVYAKGNEWTELGILANPPPQQTLRNGFYKRQFGVLGIADRKHKTLSWRTGRTYHAILAGVPALVEHDNPLKVHFPSFVDGHDLKNIREEWLKNPLSRLGAWEKCRKFLELDRQIVEQTLQSANL